MHGRVKIKTTAQQAAERDRERREKAKQFQGLTNLIFDKRRNNDHSTEALQLTGKLLAVNPDFTTIWNYRREIVISKLDELNSSHKESARVISQNEPECDTLQKTDDSKINVDHEPMESDEDVTLSHGSVGKQLPDNTLRNELTDKLLTSELELTIVGLHKNPKSYSVWHHRSWTILRMCDPDLNREISLCGEMLDLDERNFHCWDYRRFVSSLASVGRKEELDFTLGKIRQNFSNFSSWFYRSSVYDLEYPATSSSIDAMPVSVWNEEFDLVQNAFFTDPDDASPWLYLKWLLKVAGLNNSNIRLLSDKPAECGDRPPSSECSRMDISNNPSRSASIVPMETSTCFTPSDLQTSEIAALIYDPKYGRFIVHFLNPVQSVPFTDFSLVCRPVSSAHSATSSISAPPIASSDTDAGSSSSSVATTGSTSTTGTTTASAGHHHNYKCNKSSSDWNPIGGSGVRWSTVWFQDLTSKERLDTQDIPEITFHTGSHAGGDSHDMTLGRLDQIFMWTRHRSSPSKSSPSPLSVPVITQKEKPDIDQSDASQLSESISPGSRTPDIDAILSSCPFLTRDKFTNIKTLQQMEPNNKWVHLILGTILRETSIYDRLIEMDPMRKNYYLDQQTKHHMEAALSDGFPSQLTFKLDHCRLTGLYCTQWLTHLRTLDLSGNHFTHLGGAFNSLLCLENLIMDGNRITRIGPGFTIDHLLTISLKNNRISTEEGIKSLRACKRLKRVLIEGNPLTEILKARRREDTEIWYLETMDVY